MNTPEDALRRGWQLHQSQRFKEAEGIYRQVLQVQPQNANGWCYLGIVLHDQRQYPSAVEAYQRALKLNPQFPIALNNLGNSLRYVGEIEQADACFQKAIALKPDYLNAYKNRGTLHVWTGNLEAGLRYYQQALEINDQDAELHRNLGVLFLLQGDFQRGWQEYRWRWKVGDLHRPFPQVPVWQGQDLRGGSIVLTAEQGLGDTLHFVRFAHQVAELGAARVIVSCQPALLAILQASKIPNVVPNNLPLTEPVHYQCSLLDVADVLSVNETRIPAPNSYLTASSSLHAFWASRLPERRSLRVGLNWQGNPDHQADVFRSIPLRHFEPLADIDGVDLISLQAGHGVQQVRQWAGASSLMTLANVDQSGGAFMDTAAIIRSLDLVVTSDTAIAHLSAALGVPTWIVLGFVPDWRWLLHRADSPWYPSVRLFRQASMGDWQGVFQHVRRALEELSTTA